MGYDGKKFSGDRKKDFLERIQSFNYKTENVISEVIGHAYVSTSLGFAAIKRTDTQSGEICTYVCTILMELHDGFLLFKELSEDCLPFYYNCPKKLLKITDEHKPKSENSVEWRLAVNEYHKEKAQKAKKKKSLPVIVTRYGEIEVHKTIKISENKTFHLGKIKRKKAGWIAIDNQSNIVTDYRYYTEEQAMDNLNKKIETLKSVN